MNSFSKPFQMDSKSKSETALNHIEAINLATTFQWNERTSINGVPRILKPHVTQKKKKKNKNKNKNIIKHKRNKKESVLIELNWIELNWATNKHTERVFLRVKKDRH